MPANTNGAFGLVPIQRFGAADYRNSATLYFIPAAVTHKIVIGDPVVKTSGLADAQGIKSVDLATAGAGNAITGAVVGFLGSNTAGAGANNATMWGNPSGPFFRPASTALDYYVFVDDDPSSEFIIQENDNYTGVPGTPLPVSAVGLNANLVSGTANAFGQSGWQLNANGVATTQNFQLNIKSFVQSPANTAGATFAKVIVGINQHTETPNTVGI